MLFFPRVSDSVAPLATVLARRKVFVLTVERFTEYADLNLHGSDWRFPLPDPRGDACWYGVVESMPTTSLGARRVR